MVDVKGPIRHNESQVARVDRVCRKQRAIDPEVRRIESLNTGAKEQGAALGATSGLKTSNGAVTGRSAGSRTERRGDGCGEAGRRD